MRIHIFTWKQIYVSSENAFFIISKKEVSVSLDFSLRNKKTWLMLSWNPIKVDFKDIK